ncbi:MAG: VCBS repeat-containing protein [Chryseolinea sp.]
MYGSREQTEGAHLPHFAFHNNGDLTFADSSAHWGFVTPSYATGAAVVDLDNDGDLDYVTNNLNGPASVFKNHATDRKQGHFLRIAFETSAGNRNAYGTQVRINTPNHTLTAEHRVTRGYQSSLEPFVHFGLGSDTVVNEFVIIWPNQGRMVMHQVPVDTLLKVKFDSTLIVKQYDPPLRSETVRQAGKVPESATPGLYVTTLPQPPIEFRHREAPYADFKVQPLIPQQYSTLGPAMAVADVNGDRLDDLFVGGPFNQSGQILIQTKSGVFEQRPLVQGKKFEEDTGVLFFDADGDNDQDLYIVSGGNEFAEGSAYYQDRLYMNDGRGRFTLSVKAIPRESASGSCVIGNDFDSDGDIDLFVGGRLKPQGYPDAGTSFILRNDGGRFSDITAEVAPGLKNIGMVTSALWTDFDNDGTSDLIVAGEWMSVTLLRNAGGKFNKVTDQYGLTRTAGWWNSIAGADIDSDGDIDYVLGNLGYNSRYKATIDRPLHAYTSDFNDDGKREAILTQRIQNEEYPAHPRDDIFLQLPSYKKYYNSYAAYSLETADAFLKRNTKARVDTLTANIMATCVLINQGKSAWQLKPLPAEAQFAPVYGIVIKDLDADGNDDLVLTGNTSSPDVLTGKYDASKGLVLVGDGMGKFTPRTLSRSGLILEGDGRSLVLLNRRTDQLLIAGINNDSLRFRSVSPVTSRFNPVPRDAYVLVQLKDGRTKRIEICKGGGYLSQSTSAIDIPPGSMRVIVFDGEGNSREFKP